MKIKSNNGNKSTGVRELSPLKLWPFVHRWFAASESRLKDNGSYIWNQLYRETDKVPDGKPVPKLQKVLSGTYGPNISARAQYALCVVLGVTWEEISEPLD